MDRSGDRASPHPLTGPGVLGCSIETKKGRLVRAQWVVTLICGRKPSGRFQSGTGRGPGQGRTGTESRCRGHCLPVDRPMLESCRR